MVQVIEIKREADGAIFRVGELVTVNCAKTRNEKIVKFIVTEKKQEMLAFSGESELIIDIELETTIAKLESLGKVPEHLTDILSETVTLYVAFSVKSVLALNGIEANTESLTEYQLHGATGEKTTYYSAEELEALLGEEQHLYLANKLIHHPTPKNLIIVKSVK